MTTTEEAKLNSDLILARYQFITGELLRLNRETHQSFTIYVTTIATLAGSSAYIIYHWKTSGLPLALVVTTLKIVALCEIFVSICALILLVANVFSWLDYRNEEYNLLKSKGVLFRDPPRPINAWRWFEFWFALIAIIVAAAAYPLISLMIMPQLPM